MRFVVYQYDEPVGTVEGDARGYQVETDDIDLRRAVDTVMGDVAIEMFGTLDDTLITERVREFEPGEPGHMEAAIAGGGLARFGYRARKEG